MTNYINKITLPDSSVALIEDAEARTALAGKQDTITGAASTVVSSNLAAARTVITDSTGKLAASLVTSTELGYLSGTTSSVQTQLGNKANAADVYTKSQVDTSLAAKQNTLTAGSNIQIASDVISADFPTFVSYDDTTETISFASAANVSNSLNEIIEGA